MCKTHLIRYVHFPPTHQPHVPYRTIHDWCVEAVPKCYRCQHNFVSRIRLKMLRCTGLRLSRLFQYFQILWLYAEFENIGGAIIKYTSCKNSKSKKINKIYWIGNVDVAVAYVVNKASILGDEKSKKCTPGVMTRLGEVGEVGPGRVRGALNLRDNESIIVPGRGAAKGQLLSRPFLGMRS